MPVPILDLRAQYLRIKDEIDAAVAEVFDSQDFVGGPKVEGFESAMAHYLGVEHAIGVASGTDALLLALKAIDVKSGDEVITTAFSFFATAGAIANAGATPVFVDIDPATFNIDAGQIESRITPQTRAIIPVHLYGQCADMDPILDIAARHGLRVIEDAAQSIGARYHDRFACTLGHAAALSFYPSKNLGGAGDAGMIVTRDAGIAERVKLLHLHGAGKTYVHSTLGTNSRLDALQAAVLTVKLKYLDEWNRQRRALAAYYNERLAAFPQIATPLETPGNYHVYHQYVIRIPKRDAARECLRKRNIGCAVFYPLPLHRQQCFEHLGYPPSACPEATRASEQVLALPIYPELTHEQQDEVIAAIAEHIADGSAT